MGSRTTLSLLLLVLVLGGVLFFTQREPGTQGNVSVPVLGGHTLDRAIKLRWELADHPPVELRREPGDVWRLTEPLRDVAALGYLRNIAVTYDSAQMAEEPRPDTEAQRQQTGLDRPRARVEVVFEDGQTQKLELGSQGVLGNDVYVRCDGRIYRGGLALLTSLQVSPTDLRDRTIFRLPSALVTELKVDRKQGDGRSVLRLVRAGEHWQLKEPIEARADDAAATNFLEHVLNLRIDQFPPGVIRFREGPPDVVITVTAGKTTEMVPLWLDEQLNLIGRLEARKIGFVSENKQYTAIFDNAEGALRARVLVPTGNVHQDLVTVMVDPGGGAPRLVLHRADTDSPWMLAEPVSGKASPTPVQELLTAINNLRALQFFPGGSKDPNYGLLTDGLRVGTQTKSQREPAFVRIGADLGSAQAELTYAARADAPDDVVAVPKGACDDIRRPWTRYVDLLVGQVAQPPQRLDLQRGASSRRFVRSEAGWQLDGDPAVRAVLDDLVDEVLRDLRAKRALSARLEQLGKPDWTIKLCRVEGDVLATLSFWERGDGPLLVQNETQPELVFELSPRDSTDLRALWK